MSLRARVHEIIFEADTPSGKLFDVALLGAIVASVVTVMLESVSWIKADYGPCCAGWNGFSPGYSRSSTCCESSVSSVRLAT